MITQKSEASQKPAFRKYPRGEAYVPPQPIREVVRVFTYCDRCSLATGTRRGRCLDCGREKRIRKD